jgi:hypothetical protein
LAIQAKMPNVHYIAMRIRWQQIGKAEATLRQLVSAKWAFSGLQRQFVFGSLRGNCSDSSAARLVVQVSLIVGDGLIRLTG